MTRLDETGTPAGGNADLATMHRELIALGNRLEKSKDFAATPAAIDAISDQILAVNARTTALGSLLLVAQSDEIAARARRVSAAIPVVEREIEELGGFERIVTGVAAVLDAADEAIRAATILSR